ncbi:AMP-binding protein, partial [Duganella rhizosphaerae]|uniref:AMP-binding protein n=1 Tax=Duganella rhizosphaerae TaxID=2885763 RepID=UPI00403F2F40
ISIGDQGVASGVRGTHALLTQLLRHEHAPLALAQRCSAVRAPLPLFSSLLNYRHSQRNEATDTESGWDGVVVLTAADRSTYPLTLSVDDFGNGFALTVQVDQSVSAGRICGYMQTVLEHIASLAGHPKETETSFLSLDILPDAERTLVLSDWNATDAAYPSELGLHQVFEQQVALRPQAVALVHDQSTLSYAELNAQANRLARHLIAQGIGAGDYVATCLERSAELVIAQLAILKAGAAYVPLDAVLPPA